MYVGTTNSGGSIPTVVDTAFENGLIGSKILGVSFQPTTSTGTTNGQLTFGGVDETLYIGDLNTVCVNHDLTPRIRVTDCCIDRPLTTTAPANAYVGIDVTVKYGDKQLLASAGIVDTGTLLLMLASGKCTAWLIPARCLTGSRSRCVLGICICNRRSAKLRQWAFTDHSRSAQQFAEFVLYYRQRAFISSPKLIRR